MHSTDTTLKVPIRRHVLIVSTRRTIIREAQPLPIPEMHVQQPLIRAIKTDASLRQGKESVEVAHIGFQGEHAAIEAIWPSDVWDGREGVGEVEELVWSAEGDDVGIEVDEMRELGLPP